MGYGMAHMLFDSLHAESDPKGDFGIAIAVQLSARKICGRGALAPGACFHRTYISVHPERVDAPMKAYACRVRLLDKREHMWNKRFSPMESRMISFPTSALMGLAAVITSLSYLIWSIRRRA